MAARVWIWRCFLLTGIRGDLVLTLHTTDDDLVAVQNERIIELDPKSSPKRVEAAETAIFERLQD
jgi:hypothetical protein